MQFLFYLLVSMVAFFGLVFGMMVTFIAKDELRQGRNYFVALQNVIVASATGVWLFYLNLDLYFVVILTLLVFFTTYLNESARKSYIFYPLMAVLFYVSSGTNLFFVLESSLIFLYGFPTASLLVKGKKDILSVLLNHLPFLVIANLLPLVFP